MADADKTEEPSQRKLDQARKKGQIPKSQELNTVVVLFVAFYALRAFAEQMYWGLSEVMKRGLSNIGKLSLDPMTVLHDSINMLLTIAWLIGPVLGILFLSAIVINFFQVGVLLNFQGLMPNFSKLNPWSGLQRMFSKQALAQLAKATANIVVALWVLKDVVTSRGVVIFQMERMEPIHALSTLAQLTWDVALRIVMVLLIIAILDYAYQRWQNHENLKMTKQEVKDEYKQQEGDPHVKGKIRAKQREMARKRQMASVPSASVVVTNPLHIAVALQFDFDTMDSPLVLAKGQGFVADRIREIARAHDIPVIENREVARALFDQAEAEEEIPGSLYQAVAEIIAYIYQKKFAHLASGTYQEPGGTAAAPTGMPTAARIDEAAGLAALAALAAPPVPPPGRTPPGPPGARDPRGIPFKFPGQGKAGSFPPGGEENSSDDA
ncbi:MAG: flagellar biosynthesis protein FlhB [Armatimonadetes bacterium]|nr:flagellar biosynthesis protein FlhB [Armatimonadota bacterium]